MLISDICRERKEEKRLSHATLSDICGVPLPTINKFFSGNSKAPSVYTVGPICRALGVSLDAIFEIVDPSMGDEEKTRIKEEHAALKMEFERSMAQAVRESIEAGHYIEEAETKARYEKERADAARQTIKGLRTIVFGLMAVCIVLGCSLFVLLVK